jgi:nucleoside-diphosphate-sugar epimerase
MRILITAVTSAVGRDLAGQLVAAGHQVSGIATAPHCDLDPRVELFCAELRSPVLQTLADAADAIIHLAPVESGAPNAAGIAGVVRVSHAAARAGARLLFISHAAGDPDLYREAEELVSTCWAPSLVIRLAPVVGRQSDWMVCRSVATVLTIGTLHPIRVLHTDDLHRFLLRAVSSHRTGVVDLATRDAVTLVTARRLLNEAGPRLRRIPVWPTKDPVFALTPLQRVWEFDCGWTAADAMADTARGLLGRRLGATGATDVPGRVPMPVHAIPAGSAEAGVDVSGPITPMTLDIRLGGLRAADRATALPKRRMIGAGRHHRDACAKYAAAETVEQLDAAGCAALRDAQLDVRIRLLRNRIHQGWVLGAQLGALELPSAPEPTTALAELLRSDSELHGLAAAADLDTIRMSFPHFAGVLDDVLTQNGHCGPGSDELANPVFADEPAEMLAAAVLAARHPATPPPPTDIALVAGQRVWDTTARYLHQLRIAVRELGARLAAARTIAGAADVFYLTVDEALAPPLDARLRVRRRRTELRGLPAVAAQVPSTAAIREIIEAPAPSGRRASSSTSSVVGGLCG